MAMANDTTYGLSGRDIPIAFPEHVDNCIGAIYTSNIDRALRLARKLDAGAVAPNGPFLPSMQIPFRGFKSSGHRKELGKYRLMKYLRTKTILVHYGRSLNHLNGAISDFLLSIAPK